MKKLLYFIGWLLIAYVTIEIILGLVYLTYVYLKFSHLNIESHFFSNIPNRLIIKLATFSLILLITIWAVKKLKWLAYFIAIAFIILTKEPDFSFNNISVFIMKKQNHDYYKLLELQKKSHTIFYNKIKGERRYKFRFQEGKPAEDGELIEYKNYDLNGNLQQFNDTRFYYDSLNRRIKEIRKVNSTVYDTIYYKTNRDSLYAGYLKINHNYNEELTIKYDSLKNKIYSSMQLDGILDNEIEYFYDKDSRLVKDIFTTYNLGNSIITEYDYTDTTKTEYHYNVYGNLISEVFFKHDSIGNWIEQSIKSENGIHLTSYYFYNDQGKKIKEVSKDNVGYVVNEFLWEYDNCGNLITAIDYEGEGGKKKIKYVYDVNHKLKEKKVYEIESGELLWSELIVYEYFNN
jgi:hypothetical protein